MAKKTIRIKAKEANGVITVKALMTHPMESGNRKNKKTGKIIPAHFIQEVSCESGGKTRISALWGAGVSQNPYLSFQFKGASKGDDIKLSWVDNQGNSDSITTKIG
jgi:sulfur-oxidizing protein SoxZ